MLGLRRSNIEIIGDILDMCHPDGLNKTAIMYRTNLSHDQLERYLGLLSSNELIIREGSKYTLTERGHQVREHVMELMTMLRDLRAD